MDACAIFYGTGNLATDAANLATYPLLILPQANDAATIAWRNSIKAINPGILMLGYQMVASDAHTVPGPGNAIMPNYGYCRDASGAVILVNNVALHDYRHSYWRSAFLRACQTVMGSYPWDGLFLDNCAVWSNMSTDPGVLSVMQSSLQQALADLRTLFPQSLLTGNSAQHFGSLNGELHENYTDAFSEPHVQPEINIVGQIVSSFTDPLVASTIAEAVQQNATVCLTLANYETSAPLSSWGLTL